MTLSSLRALAITLPPALRTSSARRRPKPVEAPVMNQVRPWREGVGVGEVVMFIRRWLPSRRCKGRGPCRLKACYWSALRVHLVHAVFPRDERGQGHVEEKSVLDHPHDGADI